MATRAHLERWLTLTAAFCVLTVAFSFPRFALPQLYPALVKQFSWTHASAVAGGSIVLLLIGIFSPVIGWLVDRYSSKAVLLGGIVTVALALFFLSSAVTLPAYYAACTLLGVGISGVSILPTALLVAPWFSSGRGSAVGLINAGIGLGGFIAPLLAHSQFSRRGLSGTFLVIAAWMALPMVLVLLTPGATNRVPGGSHHGAISAPAVGQLFRLPLFWIFGASVFFAAHAMTAVQENLVLYLRGQGIPAAKAAFALSMAVGSSAPGKILSGAISDKFSARLATMLSIVCVGIAIVGLLTVAPASGVMYIFVVVFGMGFGGIFNAPPMIVFECFGTRQVGTVLGLFLVFFGLGTSSGGVLAGYLFDRTHGYTLPFAVDLALAGAALLLLVAGSRQTRAATLVSASSPA